MCSFTFPNAETCDQTEDCKLLFTEGINAIDF